MHADHVRVARRALAAVALLLAGCGGGGSAETPRTAESSAPSPAVVTEMPEPEDVEATAEVISASPYPDFALAVDGVVWVGNVEPGLVGFDARTGEPAVEVPTGRIKVALEQGLGSIWAVALTPAGTSSELLQVDPATGNVLSRTNVGAVSNSSLAVVDDLVWALTGLFEEPFRTLAAVEAEGTKAEEFPAPDGAKAVRGGFGSLWVSGGNGVTRIDPADGGTLATIETGRGAGLMTVTEDAVWVLNTLDGTVSRIDPETDAVVATVTASDGAVARGDIAAGEGAVWVRTTEELVTQIDARTNEVIRVLGPGMGSGSVAVAAGMVWITASADHVIQRVPVD